MKIGIVLYQNMQHAPFLRFYEDLLASIGIQDYEVIYLDRHPELGEINDERHIPVHWLKESALPSFVTKAVNALKYPFRVIDILRRKKYDFIFILTTMPAVLLYPYLKGKYAQRYIVDIRDYTRENWKWYYAIEKQAVKNSAMNIISSEGFKHFLPQAKYNSCHNLNATREMIENSTDRFTKASSGRIVISYVGHVQYAEYCIKLADLVSKDTRFELRFYGGEGGKQPVTQFVNSLGCERVRMYGPFSPADKPTIFRSSDLILNCYGNRTPLVKYAISNKQYDAALYRRPLLTSPGTTMAELSGENGYSLDLDTIESLDGLFDWYAELDCDKFNLHASSVISNAFYENEKTAEMIKAILKKLM